MRASGWLVAVGPGPVCRRPDRRARSAGRSRGRVPAWLKSVLFTLS